MMHTKAAKIIVQKRQQCMMIFPAVETMLNPVARGGIARVPTGLIIDKHTSNVKQARLGLLGGGVWLCRLLS